MNEWDKQVLIWNEQFQRRLEKTEKENRELKRALKELKWLLDFVEKIKFIGGIINEKRSKWLDRQEDI